MSNDFLHTTFGNTGLNVHRLGLSATYRPSKKAIYKAIDEGVNFFFAYGFDTQMTKTMRDVMKGKRENFVIATGAYNMLIGHPNFQRSLEKRLMQFQTDYIDIFLYLGVTKPKHLTEKDREELQNILDDGKVKAIGMSCHDRKFAGQMAADGVMNSLMIRYNAAHRGAEKDIFPHLAEHNPGIIGYTATRWRYLLRRPKSMPKDGRIPTAGECYRFVLSNPHIHVCLTAPSNIKQMDKNLADIKKGPLSDDDMTFMRNFGDVVYNQKKWFM